MGGSAVVLVLTDPRKPRQPPTAAFANELQGARRTRERAEAWHGLTVNESKERQILPCDESIHEDHHECHEW